MPDPIYPKLLSVQNIKELNNLGKYLYVAEKIHNS
jgi:hypothetical protein